MAEGEEEMKHRELEAHSYSLSLSLSLKMKRAEDEVRKTQLSRERELGRLKREETRERRQRSQAAFDTWKQLKDAEFQTERELERRYRISTTYPRRGLY